MKAGALAHSEHLSKSFQLLCASLHVFELGCLQPTCTLAGVTVLRFMQNTQTVQEPRCMHVACHMAALVSSSACNTNQQPASQSTEMQILTAQFASSPS